MAKIERIVIKLAIFLLRVYQLCLSSSMRQHCRFVPSCSDYALQAIKRFGILRGGWLSICRLGKCHPWHPGGQDSIPTRGEE